jgi:hypothetical protein
MVLSLRGGIVMGAAMIGVIGTLLGVVIGGGVNFFINRSQFIREIKL